MSITSKINSLSIFEHTKYNLSLYQATMFPNEHTHRSNSVESMVLSFRFRSIDFNKKRSLLFFLCLELLTGQKSVASLSSRNIQAWKIRKGRLVGCKVTIRKENLYSFIDTLILSLPRREKQHPFFITKTPLLNKKKTIKQFPNVAFRFGELVLFYPIEVGIGLHSDLENLQRTMNFSSFPWEERIFYLNALHFPIK